MTEDVAPIPSDLVASRVQARRQSLSLNMETLAQRCKALGASRLTVSVLTNIETGRRDDQGRRRRTVSVDELLVLALALETSPLALLLPEEDGPYRLTDAVAPTARQVYEWLIGERLPPLPPSGGDEPLSDSERDEARTALDRAVSFVPGETAWWRLLQELHRLQRLYGREEFRQRMEDHIKERRERQEDLDPEYLLEAIARSVDILQGAVSKLPSEKERDRDGKSDDQGS